jgi:hypothetical protein
VNILLPFGKENGVSFQHLWQAIWYSRTIVEATFDRTIILIRIRCSFPRQLSGSTLRFRIALVVTGFEPHDNAARWYAARNIGIGRSGGLNPTRPDLDECLRTVRPKVPDHLAEKIADTVHVRISLNFTPLADNSIGFCWCRPGGTSVRASGVPPVSGFDAPHQPEHFRLPRREVPADQSRFKRKDVTTAAACRMAKPHSGDWVYGEVIALPAVN